MGVVVLIDSISQFEEFNTMVFTISLVDEADNSIPIVSTSDVNITFNTIDGTTTTGQYEIASGGNDYTEIVNSQLTIPAGQSSATFTVTIFEDNIYENSESFTLNGVITSGNTVNTEISGIGTIENNDTLPQILINDLTNGTSGADEGNDVTFTISLSHPSSTPVLFEVTTGNGQARSPFDFEGFQNLPLKIGATTDPNDPQLSETITVTTYTDNTHEGRSERFNLYVSVISDNTIGKFETGTGIIRDIDDPPLVSVENQEVVEGNSLTFTVIIVNPDTGEPMFNYQDINFFVQTLDGEAPNEALVIADYIELTDFVTIPAGEQSTEHIVETIDDQLNEEIENFYFEIELEDADALSNVDDIVLGIGSIIDNDVPNLFSPNQDGLSDVFRISGLEKFPAFTITIFDRWGSQVYNYSNDGRSEPLWWDGTYQGKQVPEGVYYYTLNYNDNLTAPKTNFIQLVR